MIRANRRAIDAAGFAALVGWSDRWCRIQQPWNDPSCPPTINARRRAHGHRWLWDLEQIRAWRDGNPIPDLPPDHPDDLLDEDDIATLRSIAPSSVVAEWRDGYLPSEEHFGMLHTRRRDLTQLRPRPRNPRGVAREVVFAVLNKHRADQHGVHVVSLAQLMAEANVSRPTAVRYRREYQACLCDDSAHDAMTSAARAML